MAGPAAASLRASAIKISDDSGDFLEHLVNISGEIRFCKPAGHRA
jgi:hypothetical protein